MDLDTDFAYMQTLRVWRLTLADHTQFNWGCEHNLILKNWQQLSDKSVFFFAYKNKLYDF